MLGRFGRDAGSLMGVEIVPGSVRVLQLKRRKRRCEVAAWATEAFEPWGGGDGWHDPVRIAAALRNAHRRSGSRQRRVALALPASQVICKLCQLPADLPETQMEAQLLADADRLFPFPLDDLVIDFQVLAPCRTQAGVLDVMVAACRQSALQPLEQVVDEAGLQLGAVEVDSLALLRLLSQPSAGGSAVLRIEPDTVTLHCWSPEMLPLRRELPLEGAVGRLHELFDQCLQLEELLVAGASLIEQNRLRELGEYLQVQCRPLPPLAGLEGSENMALAWALALGGVQ
ncbi:type IV pilus biogenesis protein PilM [Pseudomonas putida]|uniref:Pilus assembly protein PilM n=1 Tax=Pseudomonas putida TaxID=303 RepID=A0A7W2KX62_PSEPU|nr:pilus assembly protein PilM [Pseudomonas putida]MBA6114337.1 pilus assembly protein PilM [Pseudomonas putida]